MSDEKKESKTYPTSADGYVLLQEVGVGAFAVVYRARVKETGEEVAVKVLDLEELHTNWDEIRKEILIMRSMQHPNVVPIHCAFSEQEELWIVMPFLAGGSCAHIMKRLYPNGIKDEEVIATILKETLQALVYFHKHFSLHRDIKAGNILISATGQVQLADFGVAGTLMEHGDRLKNRQTFVGTPCWMAPEVMEQTHGYDQRADIWSLGITALELGFGRAPYAGMQPMKILLATLQDPPPTCEIYNDNSYIFSDKFQSFVAKCLKKDVNKRPTAEKLLDHKFMRKAKDPHILVERLLSKLPQWVGDDSQIIYRKKKERTQSESHKPVSVESWVFEDVLKVKKQIDEAQDADANQNQADDDDSDYDTPASGAANVDPSQAPQQAKGSLKKRRFLAGDNGIPADASTDGSAPSEPHHHSHTSSQISLASDAAPAVAVAVSHEPVDAPHEPANPPMSSPTNAGTEVDGQGVGVVKKGRFLTLKPSE